MPESGSTLMTCCSERRGSRRPPTAARRAGRGTGASIFGAGVGRATASQKSVMVSTSLCRKGSEDCTSKPGTRATLVFLVHPVRHEFFDVPVGIPSVVRIDDTARSLFVRRANLDLVVVGQVTLARDVGKQVGDVAEIWLLGANVA